MKLSKSPFEKISNGEKIIESRLFDEKRKSINLNDFIEFSNDEDLSKKVLVKVQALYKYSSFSEMFSDFPSTYFGGESKTLLLSEIENFYSREDQIKFGVLGIKIKRV